MTLAIFIIILIVLSVPSFLMTRQQSKRRAEMAEMQNNLKPGDYVVTGAGVHGRVRTLFDSLVSLDVDDHVVITMDKSMVLRHQTPEEIEAGRSIRDDEEDEVLPEGYEFREASPQSHPIESESANHVDPTDRVASTDHVDLTDRVDPTDRIETENPEAGGERR